MAATGVLEKVDKVSEVDASKESWTLCARVIRMYPAFRFKNPRPYSLEMVLLDESGDKIHASIRKTLIYKFERLLKEGNVYLIFFFGVRKSCGNFLTTRHPYHINFELDTEVKPVSHSNIPRNSFSFVSAADIVKLGDMSPYLVDVIGLLTGYGLEKEILIVGNPTKMNVIEIDLEGSNDNYVEACVPITMKKKKVPADEKEVASEEKNTIESGTNEVMKAHDARQYRLNQMRRKRAASQIGDQNAGQPSYSTPMHIANTSTTNLAGISYEARRHRMNQIRNKRKAAATNDESALSAFTPVTLTTGSPLSRKGKGKTEIKLKALLIFLFLFFPFFVYGYGGTGKTFIWNSLPYAVRLQGNIVLNVASSGIASLLLPGGRTAHSRFSIPLTANESSTCNIQQGSFKAELLTHTSLIIWDEAPMVNRFCFEALDRTLRDIMSLQSIDNKNKPFGGKVVVLGGDFRQILPVVPNGRRHDIVSAAINSSDLWKHCKVLNLTTNMRLLTSTENTSIEEIKEFGNWILSIGDGNIGLIEDDHAVVNLPDELLIMDADDSLIKLVQFAYPDLLQNIKNYKFFEERTILAPRLDNVEQINDLILSLIPGEEKEYLSSDTPCISDMDDDIHVEWFTTEFLNDIKISGLSNHKLVLKVGVPVMLLRNIDQANGICNGTRLIVTYLGKNVIGATVVTGRSSGTKVLIPRMSLIPTDSSLPLKFERRQFPLVLCFAMTINKSQGQSLSHVGLYLPKPVFTHGQLYVALSRVRNKRGLKILILDDEGKPTNSTLNVVYKEIFAKVK
ncbi:hypothetical protein RIF29_17008 [Crotalaria pallida]|uniref:ATP-dependent DNA helicase n=1 Tax=Crotalaria pallida TaxID=3830 RepID=A0AAN9FG84_CROPI